MHMTRPNIILHRLINQQIAESKFTKPGEIVSWLVAMQAQDFAMAKWAIGLRLPGSNEADIQKAFDEGTILRTHLMRPTWHFITPADIRWLLALTAPRVNVVSAYYYRKCELDAKVFKRSNQAITKALEGGKHLTRTSLKTALERKKILTDVQRLSHIMLRAELDGVICSGPRQGRQFTYALLEERVPATKALDREEALAIFANRYFASRGPASIRDFVWWSGLGIREAKAGIAALGKEFTSEETDGTSYIFLPASLKNKENLQSTFLMPDYDEYGISYKNRSALFDPKIITQERLLKNIGYRHILVINGVIAGTWSRIMEKNVVVVETTPFKSLSKTKEKSVANAVKSYTCFLQDNHGK